MAETPFGKLVVELGLNNVQFTKGLSDAQKQLRTLKRAIKASDEDIKLMGKGSQAASTKMTLLSQAFKTTGYAVNQLKFDLASKEEALRKLRVEIEATDTKTKEQTASERKLVTQIEKLKGKLVEATASMSMYRREYAETAKAQAIANNGFIKAGTRLEATGKRLTESGNRILNVARGWTFASAILGTGIGLVAKQAIDYEKAIAGVRKTTDPTTAQLQEFSLGFRKMSTEIPVAAKELANMGQMAGQLGIRNDNLLTFVETMAKLQTATNIIGEEGAADLAKFMNIMGTSQDKVSNLGSTLVDLGNHFATTERDILDMGKNLAGAGRQIGLSEASVLGIATALSSVGVEAEKGGSAFSKVMIQMASAVDEMDTSAGSKLSEFAGVAGMTAESFANMFKSHPEQAIAAFVEGLGTANEKGTTAIGILQEMGIKEVRLRDTLLRAGGAHKLFNDAVNMGNKAFKENTALQKEFNTFNDTTASKLERAKNKLTDLAIEAGGKLLPVIADLLGKSGYVIDGVKGMIEGFSNLPEPIQKTALALTGLGLVGGPVLGVIGQAKNMIGLFAGGLGGLLKHMGQTQVKSQELKGAFDLANSALGATAGSAVEAGAGMANLGGEIATTGGLASKIMGLGLNPWLVGVAAAVGLGVTAWKLFGENMWNSAQEASKSASQMKKWGTQVSDTVDKALHKAEDFSNQAGAYLSSGLEIDEKTKSNVVTAYAGMFEQLRKTADEKLSTVNESYGKLSTVTQEYEKNNHEKRVKKIEEAKGAFDKIEADINAIYDKAGKERRALTENEINDIKKLREKAALEESKILSGKEQDQMKIFKNLSESLKSLDNEELNGRLLTLDKMKQEEDKNYKDRLENAKKLHREGEIDEYGYKLELRQIESDHNDKMKELAFQQYQTTKEQIKRLREEGTVQSNETADQYETALEETMKRYGFSMQQMETMAKEKSDVIAQRNKYIAQSVTEMGIEIGKATEEANKKWESLITDEKTGKIVNNISKTLTEATKTEKGWNDLKFVVKNASLTSNAKEEIEKALKESKKWDELSPEEKAFLTSTNIGDTIAHVLQSKGKWDDLTIEQKVAVLNTSGIDEATMKFIDLHNLWEQKDFVAKLAKIDTTAPDAKEKIKALTEEFANAKRLGEQGISIVADSSKPIQAAKDVDNLTQKMFQAKDTGRSGVDFVAQTNAQQVTNQVWDLINAMNNSYDKTVSFTTVWKNVYQSTGTSTQDIWSAHMNNYATGTEGHTGGLAFLGDGGRREPFLTPDGYFGVSPSTDTLYNLPRGTKVWSSIDKFKRDTLHKPYLSGYLDKLPRFSKGTLKSFIDNTNVRVPDVFKSRNTVDNSTYAPVLHIENFHADNGMDVEELFRQFKWMIKREGDRA